ncbi:ABC transporter permease subunit [Streptomyces sp. NPDC048441]|uniref:ABC transporter permease subunit n=1 Tax=Streptomyces sp. NPDC048441 TaxID=3365552 RepID=UPI003713CEFB
MTTVTPTRRPSTVVVGRDGFPQLLRAEWTKLRTVRRWGFTLLAAVLVTLLISLFSASSSGVEIAGGGSSAATGPDGQSIRDDFTFVHRTLPADGSITARVTGPTGVRPDRAPEWAKAGVIVKQNTQSGSDYAALMVTPGHGVRFQSDFTHDVAGGAASASTPHWLRLTRKGATITAYASADGRGWKKIGTTELAEQAGSVPVGLFVASPNVQSMERKFGNVSVNDGPSRSTARFDEVTVKGSDSGADWQRTDVGREAEGEQGKPGQSAGEPGAGKPGAGQPDNGGQGQLTRSGGTFTLTGSGDIAPGTPVQPDLVATSLNGTQLGLVLIAALGVLFITAEYRRGMIRTTFLASPRRGRVLVAKAVVISAVTFATGLVTAIASFLLTMPVLRDNGHKPPLFPEFSLTDGPVLRALFGTAALLALIAVLALGLGALMRNTAAAITTVVVVIVLPLILVSVLPLGLSQWLQRLTPVAGFAVQESTPRHHQVASLCLPEDGCYPQGAWTGLATLAAYAVVVLGIAVWRIRKKDA